MERPELHTDLSVKDFDEFYWLKEELTVFCRIYGISTAGGKMDIEERIRTFLFTGEVICQIEKQTYSSNFDWKNAELTLKTPITDNYKNTENVRAFMKKHIGEHFKFNVEWMNWLKINVGKNLGEAAEEWKKNQVLKKSSKTVKNISPQFEYNTYIRDFLADNKDKSLKEAIEHWKIKKSKRGDNRYSKEDLNFFA
jgi:ribosomal protein S8